MDEGPPNQRALEFDTYGIGLGDWENLCIGFTDMWSPVAWLWFALAGSVVEAEEGEVSPRGLLGEPLTDMLTLIARDVRGLARMGHASQSEEIRAIAESLHNLERRLLAASEFACRVTGFDREPPSSRPGPQPKALPAPRVPAKRRKK